MPWRDCSNREKIRGQSWQLQQVPPGDSWRVNTGLTVPMSPGTVYPPLLTQAWPWVIRGKVTRGLKWAHRVGSASCHLSLWWEQLGSCCPQTWLPGKCQ